MKLGDIASMDLTTMIIGEIYMGMYNEVYCTCPKCNGVGYMQISQIVPGFGEFSLPDGHNLRELTKGQLIELKGKVMRGNFKCQNCGNVFNPYEDSKEELIHELFSMER